MASRWVPCYRKEEPGGKEEVEEIKEETPEEAKEIQEAGGDMAAAFCSTIRGCGFKIKSNPPLV